jgi:hypothetical protein
MIVNRGELRQSLRQTLRDTTAWPDAALNRWIDEAIADYSVHFRLTYQVGLPAVQGFMKYDLDLGRLVLDVLWVMYLTPNQPGLYLARMDRNDPRFRLGNHYDITYDGSIDYAVLQLSQPTPPGTGAFWLAYETSHLRPTSDISELSVPAHHLDALRLFVVWKALQQIEVEKALSAVDYVDTGLVALPLVGSSAARAAALYRQKLRELTSRSSAGGVIGPWKIPGL